MGKTVKKVSWRTLNRMADKAPTPGIAKTLRERAARERREERKAKAAAALKQRDVVVKRLLTRKAKANVGTERIKSNSRTIKAMASKVAQQIRNRQRSEALEAVKNLPTPVSTTFAGVDIAVQARAILVEARKKRTDPTQALTDRLAQIVRVAEYEGKRFAESQAEKVAKVIRDKTREKVIAGFLAVMEAYEHDNKGLPKIMKIGGFTAAAIIDALHDAGYTSMGRRTEDAKTGDAVNMEWRAVERPS
jgi:hypothetical protein